MRLSDGVEWGVHVCVLLATLPDDAALPAAKLAEYHGVPAAYLAKHLQALAGAGVLQTVKGAREIRGKIIGIVGYGHIGTQLSVMAEAMGMQVRFYDTVEKLSIGNAQACRSLDELLAIPQGGILLAVVDREDGLPAMVVLIDVHDHMPAAQKVLDRLTSELEKRGVPKTEETIGDLKMSTYQVDRRRAQQVANAGFGGTDREFFRVIASPTVRQLSRG